MSDFDFLTDRNDLCPERAGAPQLTPVGALRAWRDGRTRTLRADGEQPDLRETRRRARLLAVFPRAAGLGPRPGVGRRPGGRIEETPAVAEGERVCGFFPDLDAMRADARAARRISASPTPTDPSRRPARRIQRLSADRPRHPISTATTRTPFWPCVPLFILGFFLARMAGLREGLFRQPSEVIVSSASSKAAVGARP